MRKAIYATMILVSVWVIASFIGQIFICTPIAGAYDLRLAAVVKCGDRPKFFQTDVSINVILDVIVIALPLCKFWFLIHASVYFWIYRGERDYYINLGRQKSRADV